MSEEEIKQNNEEPIEETTINEETKQKSKVGKFFSSVGSKAGSAVKKVGTNIATGIQNTIDKFQEQRDNNEKFEKTAIKYTVYSEKIKNGDIKGAVEFFAIKSIQDSSLLVRTSDALTVNTVILSSEGSFIINDVDSKNEIDYPLDGSSSYPIKCYKCLYKAHKVESAPAVVNNVINQSTVIHGDNHGDITQIASLQSNLDKIEAEIQKFKTNPFNKKKKEEALYLFGNFKNCVINKQKNETLFAKFLDILKVVAPAAITLATTLIAAL